MEKWQITELVKLCERLKSLDNHFKFTYSLTMSDISNMHTSFGLSFYRENRAIKGLGFDEYGNYTCTTYGECIEKMNEVIQESESLASRGVDIY